MPSPTPPVTLEELCLDGKVKRAVEQLYSWQHEGATGFTSKLYELMRKADATNYRQLSTAFPEEAHALETWLATPEEQLRAFFERWMGPLPPEKPPYPGSERLGTDAPKPDLRLCRVTYCNKIAEEGRYQCREHDK